MSGDIISVLSFTCQSLSSKFVKDHLLGATTKFIKIITSDILTSDHNNNPASVNGGEFTIILNNILVVTSTTFHLNIVLVVANNTASDYNSVDKLFQFKCNSIKSVDIVFNQDLLFEDNPTCKDYELTNIKLSGEEDYYNYSVDILACNLGAEPRFSYS